VIRTRDHVSFLLSPLVLDHDSNLSGSKRRIIVVNERLGFAYVDCKQT
jgi:hypothetical protein